MGDGYSLKRLDALEAKQQMLEYIHTTFPVLESEMRVNLWFSCMYHYQQALMWVVEKDQQLALTKIASIKNTLPISKTDFSVPSLKQKLWLLLASISFDITCRLRNRLKIGV